jgi:hypothetical protein
MAVTLSEHMQLCMLRCSKSVERCLRGAGHFVLQFWTLHTKAGPAHAEFLC